MWVSGSQSGSQSVKVKSDESLVKGKSKSVSVGVGVVPAVKVTSKVVSGSQSAKVKSNGRLAEGIDDANKIPRVRFKPQLEAGTSDCCIDDSADKALVAFDREARKVVSFLSSGKEDKCLSSLEQDISSYGPRSYKSNITPICIQESMKLGSADIYKYGQCENGSFEAGKMAQVSPCASEEMQKKVSRGFDFVIECTGEDPHYLFSLWNHESRFVSNISSGKTVIGVGQVARISIKTLNDEENRYNPKNFFKESCKKLKSPIKNQCDRLDPLKSMTYGALHVKSYRSILKSGIDRLKKKYTNRFPPVTDAMEKKILLMSYNAGSSLFALFMSFIQDSIRWRRTDSINDINAFIAFLENTGAGPKRYPGRWEEQVKPFVRKVIENEEYINRKAGRKCGGMANL